MNKRLIVIGIPIVILGYLWMSSSMWSRTLRSQLYDTPRSQNKKISVYEKLYRKEKVLRTKKNIINFYRPLSDALWLDINNTLGTFYKERNEASKATQHVEEILALQPEDKASYVELLRLYKHGNNVHDFAEVYARYIKHFDEAPDVAYLDDSVSQYVVGMQLLNNELFAHAERIFLHLTRLHPHSSEMQFRLGKIYEYLHKDKNAEICFRKALTIQPLHANALYHLREVYKRLGNATALSEMAHTIENIPNDELFVRKTQSNSVVSWNFDEDHNDVVCDVSKNENHGRRCGPVYTEGIRGEALRFDGIDDYVEIKKKANLRHYDGFLLSFWILPKDMHKKQELMSDIGKWRIFIDKGQFCFYTRGVHHKDKIRTTTKYAPFRWYHIMVSFNSNTGEKSMYVNNTLDGSKVMMAGINTIGLEDHIIIGNTDRKNTMQPFAIIDEIKMYSYTT